MTVPLTKIKLIPYGNPDVDLMFGNVIGIDKICCLTSLELHSLKDTIIKGQSILLLYPRLFDYSTEIPESFIERIFDSMDPTTHEIFVLLPFESLEIIVKILKEEILFRGYHHLQVDPQIFHTKEPNHRAYLIGTKTNEKGLVVQLSEFCPEIDSISQATITQTDSNKLSLGSWTSLN